MLYHVMGEDDDSDGMCSINLTSKRVWIQVMAPAASDTEVCELHQVVWVMQLTHTWHMQMKIPAEKRTKQIKTTFQL